MFDEVVDPKEIICTDCESEYIIQELHSNSELAFCPFCGVETESEEDDD